MSKGKEYITMDDLTDMLSDIRKKQVEQMRTYPATYCGDFQIGKFCGKLDVIMQLFYFLGLGTKSELKETKEKIISEIMEEIRSIRICQI